MEVTGSSNTQSVVGAESNTRKNDVRRKFCEHCGNHYTDSKESVNHEGQSGPVERQKTTSERKIKVLASEEHRDNLYKVSNFLESLGGNYPQELVKCRERLEAIIRGEKSVLRHKEGFIFSIDASKETEDINKTICNIIIRINKKLTEVIYSEDTKKGPFAGWLIILEIPA